MKIKTTMRGMDEVKKLLTEAPRGTKIVAMEAIATYVIGDESHGLAHAPERVEHGVDNPYEWQSDKQRRWWFATHDGPYTRTDNLSAGWVFESQDSNWTSVQIQNIEDYAGYVMGDQQQRGHVADGWRYYWDVILSNINGAIAAGQRKIDEWIGEHNG